MKEMIELNNSNDVVKRRVKRKFNVTRPSSTEHVTNPVIDNLIAEGGEAFLDYIKWHGLVNEPNMLILSSKYHYYYDHEDLKSVTTLINLKQLNLINHLDVFFKNVCNGLSPKTNFIGCFYDKKTQKGKSLPSRMYKKIINFLDLRIDTEIDKTKLSRLLESNGLKVIDMTEINGLTYFRTQNNRITA